MKKIIISIVAIILMGVGYRYINKKDILFSESIDLPKRFKGLSFSNFPEPPNYEKPNIKNIDSEILIRNKFLKMIGDSLLREPIIQALKINDSENDYIIIEKLEGVSLSNHNTILLSLKCKFKINELFSRITMTATEVVVEAVPKVLKEENYPVSINFSMTKLKINDLPPAIEKGLAHLATKALNEIDVDTDLAVFKNLSIEKPQSNEIISPDFQEFGLVVEESGLTLIMSIDE